MTTACLAVTDHCCYLNGQPCAYVRDDGPQAPRRFVCTLRERAGSWEGAYALPEYEAVKTQLDAIGLPDCGDWPLPGATCAECGAH